MKVAKVIFNIPIEKSFHYFVDDDIERFVRVLAPLGNRNRKGFVVEILEKFEDTEYKLIKKIYDSKPLINEEIFKISKIVSQKYYSSLGQTIFSIIGGFPLKYEKNKISSNKKISDSSSNNFKKEIHLFSDKKEKLDFYLKTISQTSGSIIFMFPEISILENYYNEFKNKTNRHIIRYYGEMKSNEKFENYIQALNGENLIIVGTKVAVFSPIVDLKCIVIDFPSNTSYVSKRYPKYNAVKVAEERAFLRKIPIIFTSNSLSLTEYYEVKRKKLYLIDNRNFMNTPEVLIIDRNYAETDKNIPFLSKFSASLIEETIIKGKKVGIVHNKKGSSKTFKCEKCGRILRCKNCNSYLVLSDENNLVCKYCKTIEQFKEKCPNCGNKNIIERIVGIEKIYKILKSTYPDFQIQKLTAEEKKVLNISDIFVGTKILTKILNEFDFGLIIFPYADSFLNVPEYNSEETLFLIVNDFLWELNKDAKIIIQTKNPNFEIFNSLKTKNFEIFYEKEINIRKLVGYPPVSDIMLIEIPVKKSKSFESNLNFLKKIIEDSNLEILFSDIISDKKRKKIFKIILRLNGKILNYDEIMSIKEKLDFKIEINPKII
ncbi:MAG: hypothetical protein NC915_03830 [Candidatus Omnitrophica bacterium]|nr:hypothetical protein [Candidatus Omnitrophota bacterium]